jgi:voltage-gated potassium channel
MGIAMGVGVFGFMFIEDYNFLDALYMTVITISTVGFSEIHPLSAEGRAFTTILIITNIGVFFYSITTITSFLVDGEFQKFLKMHKVNKVIEKLENHVIVCGYGRNGMEVCEELASTNVTFIVIENDEAAIKEMKERGYLWIEGDATNDDTLHSIKLEQAKAIITTLPKDADNVFVALTAKEINPNVNVISRASLDASETKLRRAGADHVIMPEKIGGEHMAKLVTKPDIMDFIALITGQEEINGTKMNIEEFGFDNMPIGEKRSIIELNIRNKTGANVIGIKDEKGFHVNPSSTYVIDKHSKLIVLGTDESILKCKNLFSNH